mgnify:CR=1 FL=1
MALNFRKKKINHVAIIMDGNGRWAAKNKISKKKGHEYGVRNCIKICENLKKLGLGLWQGLGEIDRIRKSRSAPEAGSWEK